MNTFFSVARGGSHGTLSGGGLGSTSATSKRASEGDFVIGQSLCEVSKTALRNRAKTYGLDKG
jgi:hypothetical protein